MNPFVILCPLQPCVCDVYLLNPMILVVMLIYQGLSGHSADYRVYMSESMRMSTCQREQPYLILYKLGGSITALITAHLFSKRQAQSILSLLVFYKQSFGFKKPILTKTLATGKFIKTYLQNYASYNLLLSPIEDYQVAK